MWAWIFQPDRNWNKRIFVKATVLVAYKPKVLERICNKRRLVVITR